MTLQSSGTISFSQLAAEYGDSAPHSLSEFYRNGSLVPNSITSTSVGSIAASSTSVTGGGTHNGSGNNAANICQRVIIPAGGSINCTIPCSFPSGYPNHAFNFGNYSVTSNKNAGGWWIFWQILAGSGLSLGGPSARQVNLSSVGSGNGVIGQLGGNYSRSFQSLPASFNITITGTAGGSGCTLGWGIAAEVNNSQWRWRAPTNASGWTGTSSASVTTSTNVNQSVATSGQQSISNYYGGRKT